MRRLVIVSVALLSIAAPAQAGGGGHGSACSGFATGTSITMLDSCFAGTAHFAPAGTAITVRNDGQVPHTFTAVDGSFDSGQVLPGDTFELAVEEPGIHPVFCSLHGTAAGEGMAGVLVVGEPEPGPVAATLNIDAIRQAVSEEARVLADGLVEQNRMIGSLTTAQARLTEAMEDRTAPFTASEAAATEAAPTTDLKWSMAAIGLAAGLALAALAGKVSIRRRRDALGPSLES